MNSDAMGNPKQNMTAKRLQSLYELIERMNSVHELQDLLDFVVERTLSLTGGRHGLLLLSDNNEDELEHIAVIQGPNVDEKNLKEPLKLVSTSVIKDILERGQPRLVVDLQVDERFKAVASVTTQQVKRVRSVLAVPLKVEAQLIGLIYIDHPKKAVFGQEDLDFLSAFASQAALAIERGRKHQRQIEELTLLNTLSRSVVQVLDLEEVLTRIVHEANRMLGVETGSVLLLDEERNELYFATAISEGQRITIPTRLQKEQGIAGWVVSSGEPACVSDVAKDSRWYGEVETGFNFVTRSLLCVPLQSKGKVMGVLEVFNKKSPFGFDSSDVTLLAAFASSATIAIENARLFQEARQVSQLRAINEVLIALTSSLELETIVNKGLEQTLKLLKVKASAIRLFDEQSFMPPIQISHGLLSNDPQDAEQMIDELAQLSSRILTHADDEPLVIDNLQARPDLSSQALAVAGIEAVAVAPIKVGDKISGALLIMSQAEKPFSTDDINLLISIAPIIGLAVQNANHFNQTRSQTMRLTYINDVGRVLTGSLDRERVLQFIIELVNSLLETERTSVFLIDPDTKELVLRYHTEGPAEIRLPAGQGIAGWVAENDKPALVNDTHSDPRHLRKIAVETGYEANSILCVPLKVEQKVIGVVEVLNQTSKQQFTMEHQVRLTELAQWAGIAIQNANLYNELGQAYQKLYNEKERRYAAEMRGAMASVILDMAHTMNNIVGAIRVWATSLEHKALNRPELPLAQFKRELTNMRQNAEEAIKLIKKMTDPLKQPDISPTDIHSCLADAIKSCFWPENVQLRQDYGHDVPMVKADAERLEAALNNLLSNASKALEERGGEVRVTTRRTSHGQAEIWVADNGPGIPRELQQHIFTPQFSDKEDGLGIGLWLTETYINQFEGTITFTSSTEHGTTFKIILQPAETELDYQLGHSPVSMSGEVNYE